MAEVFYDYITVYRRSAILLDNNWGGEGEGGKEKKKKLS